MYEIAFAQGIITVDDAMTESQHIIFSQRHCTQVSENAYKVWKTALWKLMPLAQLKEEVQGIADYDSAMRELLTHKLIVVCRGETLAETYAKILFKERFLVFKDMIVAPSVASVTNGSFSIGNVKLDDMDEQTKAGLGISQVFGLTDLERRAMALIQIQCADFQVATLIAAMGRGYDQQALAGNRKIKDELGRYHRELEYTGGAALHVINEVPNWKECLSAFVSLYTKRLICHTSTQLPIDYGKQAAK